MLIKISDGQNGMEPYELLLDVLPIFIELLLNVCTTIIKHLIRLLSLFVYIMNKTGTAVNKVKSLLKS